MKITLFYMDKILKFTLPEQISGSFSFDYNEDSDIKLINIEAKDDKWYLYTTDDVNVIYNNSITDGLYLELNNYYLLQKNSQNFLIYVSAVFDNTFNCYRYNVNTNLTIGNTSECNVYFNIPYINNMIVYIKMKDNKFMLLKNNNSIVYKNNNYVKEENTYLNYGDTIEIYGLKIYLMANYILINNPNNQVTLNTAMANLTLENFIEEEISNTKVSEIDLYNDNDYFSKAPRIKRNIEQAHVKLDSPPKREEDKDMPFILVIGPMLTMGMISFVMVINTINKIATHQTTLSKSWSSMLIGVVMLVSVLVWPLLIKAYNKKQKNKKDMKIIVKYDQYLEEKKHELLSIVNLQTNIINEQLITLQECLNIIINKKLAFWDKRVDQNDFLTVRIGHGKQLLNVDISFPEEGFSVEENTLKERAYQLVDAYKYINDVPIGYSFFENKVTAIMGNYLKCKKFIDNCLLQLITFYSYDDLKFVLFTNKENSKDWEYIKYLNHTFNNQKNIRFYSSDNESAKKLSEYFNFEVAQRLQQLSENENDNSNIIFKPYYLIILDGYDSVKNYEFIKQITELDINIGFSIIILENKMNNLPSKCNNFILLNDNLSGVLKNSYEKQEKIDFNDEIVYDLNMMEISKVVANIPIKIDNEEYELPDAISFLEMEKVGKVEQLNILNRWNTNDPTLSLKAEVGLGTSGELIYLDLHEKAHGPHGLIAGMTGSGKSEFIITYVLSMCINYSPNDVAFILIDYKGGGLAFAFENQLKGISLPHLAGIITNLDEAEMNRTLVSIDSEIKQRQKIFNEVRDQFEESTMDIYKYQRFYKDGKVTLAIPHLFIICDEFAELKSQQPGFIDDLISVARIGRSLGIHLILATQKPTGVVNDQIWSNSKFRVCLRVQDKSDSNEMLKKPDAAALKQTGRFYLQVGYDELYELGQSAWCGAKYTPTDKIIKQVDNSINFIDDCGTFIKNIKASSDTKVETKYEQISVILDNIISIASSVHIKAKRLWLDNIIPNILIDDLILKYAWQKEDYHVKAIIGEYDAPSEQKQGLLELDFKEQGNTVILGTDGEERELVIKSLIYSLALNYLEEEVNIYTIDYGSESLNMFEQFNQVGGTVYSGEDEKYKNLFKLINEELALRKKKFAAYEGNYYRYIQTTNDYLPIIILIINNLDLIMEMNKNVLENLTALTRDSERYGIYFVLTASNRAIIGRKLLQNFDNVYALHLNDQSDYPLLFNVRTKIVPGKDFGRGLTKIGENVYEFQTSIMASSSTDLHEVITSLASTVNSKSLTKAKPIPILPKMVTSDIISNDISTLQSVPIGMSKQSLKIAKYDFSSNTSTIITASKLEKINTFILSLYSVLKVIPNTQVIMFDVNNLLSNYAIDNYYNNDFQTNLENIKTTITNQTGNIVLIFYGITKLKMQLNNMTLVSDIINYAKKEMNIKLIICDGVKNLKNVEYENWYLGVKTNTDGIWIGSGFEEQSILRHPTVVNEVSDNNEGYVVIDSESENVKFINFIDSEETLDEE